MASSREILQKAIDLVEAGWVKDKIAMHQPASGQGFVVSPFGDTVVTTREVKSKGEDGKKKVETVTDTTFYPATHFSLTGAIMAAEGLNSTSRAMLFSTSTFRLVAQALAARGWTGIGSLANFNDPDNKKGKTTQQDVLAVLREALQLAID